MVNITTANFKQEIEESSIPVILDIYATWCGPCVQMEPIMGQLEKEFSSKCKFAKLNVDETRDIAIKFGVTTIPTFLFIKDGKVITKEVGYISKEDFKEKINSFIG